MAVTRCPRRRCRPPASSHADVNPDVWRLRVTRSSAGTAVSAVGAPADG
jgi:hypothetical protein